jgi:hypothetical protein
MECRGSVRTTRRVILLLIAVMLLAAPALRADHDPWPQTLAGTWFYSTIVGPGATLPGLVTYNADGTVAYSDATMFGGFAAAYNWKFGPYYGVWEKTGRDRFGTTAIGLIFEPDSNVVIGFARGRSALHFEGGSLKLVGTLWLEVLMCPAVQGGSFACPDPTDPALASYWIPFGGPGASFPIVLTRVTRVPAG